MTYSCRKSSGPRGQPRTYTVQDGYDRLRVGTIWVRVPHMVEIRTDWLPMKCGIQPQAGLPPDPLCKGCPNAQL